MASDIEAGRASLRVYIEMPALFVQMPVRAWEVIDGPYGAGLVETMTLRPTTDGERIESPAPDHRGGNYVPGNLDLIRELALARTVGAFIDEALDLLERLVGGSLVSFNRLDLIERTATIALRPYRTEHEAAVDGVDRLLDEHPLFQWYTSQSDWSPKRISDITPWEQFQGTLLFTEVLAPIGAHHTLVILLTPPRSGVLIYFAINRSDQDFSDAELEICGLLQPAFVALYNHLSAPDQGASISMTVTLTRRERAVLRYLAGGLTADAIAHQMSTRPATVRKHLQNLYAKLDTSDRLGAVIRGRDLGLLRAEEVSREFEWSIRSDIRDH